MMSAAAASVVRASSSPFLHNFLKSDGVVVKKQQHHQPLATNTSSAAAFRRGRQRHHHVRHVVIRSVSINTTNSTNTNRRGGSRLAATAPDVTVGGETPRFETDAAGFAVSVDLSSSTATTATTTATTAMPPPPPPTSFEPQVDPAPAFASVVILIAFAVVNRRVAAAVDRRKEREDAEEFLRQAKLRSLDGTADFDEVSEAVLALDAAVEKEAAAREVLAFFGADVRVRMPQPLGKPLSQVARDEANVDEAILKRRREQQQQQQRREGGGSVDGDGDGDAEDNGFWNSVDADLGGEVRERWQERVEREKNNNDGGGNAAGKRGGVSGSSSNSRKSSSGGSRGGGDGGEVNAPPGWMTATVGVVLVMLTWSAVGLMFSADPAVGPALSPEELAAQMAMR